MPNFFNVAGQTFSFADIMSISDVDNWGEDKHKSSLIRIKLVNNIIYMGFSNHEEYFKCNKDVYMDIHEARDYKKKYIYKYSENPVEDTEALREEILEGWAEFKKTVIHF